MFNYFLGLFLLMVIYSSVNAADLDTRRRAAGHPTTSVEQMWALTKDPDWRVRQSLGRNRRAPITLLDMLAQDRHPQVRIAVATNLATGEETFRRLAQDKALTVRSVVARFEYVPASSLAILATDKDADIRLEVARNPNTKRDTLEILRQDFQPEVASTAEISLQRLTDEAVTP